MTRKEAMELEKDVEELFKEALGIDCKVSLALSNKLRISFEGGFICLKLDASDADWVSYTGWYSDLQEYIFNALNYMKINKELIDKLIWSYEHITELED